MTGMIKPIETVYNGYRFRSRLEARWAVFFDTLGVRYDYEPEGFEFPDGDRYLPDFWLPDYEMWVEIKGSDPGEAGWGKIFGLSLHAQDIVLALTGPCDPRVDGCIIGFEPPTRDLFQKVWLSECLICGSLGCLFAHCVLANAPETPDDHRILAKLNEREGEFFCLDPSCHLLVRQKIRPGIRLDRITPRIANAFTAARQARFEHGEKP